MNDSLFKEGQTLRYHYSGRRSTWDVTFLRMSKTGKKAKVKHIGGPSYWQGSCTYVDVSNLEAYK